VVALRRCRARTLVPMSTRRFIPTKEWEDARQVRGLRGEQAALAYLTSCGWEIEAHRFRLGRHDVDLIARKGALIAFVEVKTRRGAGFGAGAEAVGRRKRSTIAKVAMLWRLRYGRPADSYRFDLIEVLDEAGGELTVTHVPDAWRVE
jgi:putative endonuclease